VTERALIAGVFTVDALRRKINDERLAGYVRFWLGRLVMCNPLDVAALRELLVLGKESDVEIEKLRQKFRPDLSRNLFMRRIDETLLILLEIQGPPPQVRGSGPCAQSMAESLWDIVNSIPERRLRTLVKNALVGGGVATEQEAQNICRRPELERGRGFGDKVVETLLKAIAESQGEA
jgi:hypothetical protein